MKNFSELRKFLQNSWTILAAAADLRTKEKELFFVNSTYDR